MRRRLRRAVSIATIAVGVAATTIPLRTFADPAADEWKAPARAARKKNPIPADADSLAAGKVVYTAQCAACHGPAGKGDGPSAKDLNPKPRNLSDPAIQAQSDGSLFWKITEGKKPMPTFEKLISDNDRWNVINLVRTLAAK